MKSGVIITGDESVKRKLKEELAKKFPKDKLKTMAYYIYKTYGDRG